MPLRLKLSACLAAALAVVFSEFWQFAKHQPVLGNINPFANDPYDAIGSFAVLFAGAALLLLLLRAFRLYAPGETTVAQQSLLVRTSYATCIAAAATLVADAIALLRHLAMWSGTMAGHELAALVGGMALLTLLVGCVVYATARTIPRPSRQPGRNPATRWLVAVGVSLLAIVILALYPEGWTNVEATELLTVLIATALLFAVMRAWVIALAPIPEAPYEDVIDDLIAIYRWLRAHIGVLGLALVPLEKIVRSHAFHLLAGWLNPRRYPYSIVLVSLGVGALLAISEAVGDPGPVTFALHRFAIFVGLGGGGIVIGYLFLAKPLGIFRREAQAAVTATEPSLKKG